MDATYKTQATAIGGREGKVRTEDGLLDFEVRLPKELGGKGGEYTNPEQLFAAGYSACFGSALNFVAGQKKIRIVDAKVTVNAGIKVSEGFDLVVAIDVEIPGVDKDVAKEMVEIAHTVCPYSKAIKGNVDVTLNVI